MQSKVQEFMNKTPHFISPDSTLRDAATAMQHHDCGALVVGHPDDTPSGIITDRDIVVWGLAEGRNPDTATVREIISGEVISCSKDETAEQAADKMSVNDVRRLIVVNPQNKVIGVLSTVDIIKCVDTDEINDEVIHHLFHYA